MISMFNKPISSLNYELTTIIKVKRPSFMPTLTTDHIWITSIVLIFCYILVDLSKFWMGWSSIRGNYNKN